MSTLRVTTIQSLSAVAAYTAKAWVNFNGTGAVAIRASGNVTSVTDNGTGDYTVNITNAISDANFATVGMAGTGTVVAQIASPNDQGKTTSTQRLLFGDNNGTGIDRATINVVIFR